MTKLLFSILFFSWGIIYLLWNAHILSVQFSKLEQIHMPSGYRMFYPPEHPSVTLPTQCLHQNNNCSGFSHHGLILLIRDTIMTILIVWFFDTYRLWTMIPSSYSRLREGGSVTANSRKVVRCCPRQEGGGIGKKGCLSSLVDCGKWWGKGIRQDDPYFLIIPELGERLDRKRYNHASDNLATLQLI